MEETGISSQDFRVRGLVGPTGTFISQVQSWEKVLNIDVSFPSYKITLFFFKSRIKSQGVFFYALSSIYNWAEITVLTEITVVAIDLKSHPFWENVGYMLRGGQCTLDYSCNIGKVGSGGSSQEKEWKKIWLWEQSMCLLRSIHAQQLNVQKNVFFIFSIFFFQRCWNAQSAKNFQGHLKKKKFWLDFFSGKYSPCLWVLKTVRQLWGWTALTW